MQASAIGLCPPPQAVSSSAAGPLAPAGALPAAVDLEAPTPQALQEKAARVRAWSEKAAKYKAAEATEVTTLAALDAVLDFVKARGQNGAA